jgi:hypothetical protein
MLDTEPLASLAAAATSSGNSSNAFFSPTRGVFAASDGHWRKLSR